MDSETSGKKSKRSRANKKLEGFAELSKKDDKGLLRKQAELLRVLHVKNFQLQSGNLSYLDYIELREELLRLNALKDVLQVGLWSCGGNVREST